MNDPINQDEFNRILLKPRFKLKYSEPKDELIELFKEKLKDKDFGYPNKFIDHHIVIDVPASEEHFWSPQLHIEIEEEGKLSIVKGILGPKPKIWTFFIFLHFLVAGTFFIFFVIFYSKWSLDQDYGFSMTMCILMPILWVILYFAGQLGKKFGYEQMVQLKGILEDVLRNKKMIAAQ